MRGRQFLLATTMFSGLAGMSVLTLSPATAADLYTKAPSTKAQLSHYDTPAVDGFNTKFAALGGSMGNRSLYEVQGSLSIPLGNRWGLQIDGIGGVLDGRTLGAIAGHWFWRDPGEALLGVYASHTYWAQAGGVHISHVSVEGERYWQRWTLQGIVGVEFGNSAFVTSTGTSVVPQNGATPGAVTVSSYFQGYDIKTRFFDQINLKYYFTDDWASYIGHRYLGGRHMLALGSEYAMPIGKGVSSAAFVEARLGAHDAHGLWGGMRFYWGQKDKPLIARHRQDDPPVWMVDTLFGIINSQTSGGSSNSTPFCTAPDTLNGGTCQPPPPDPDPCGGGECY